jgi:hypothetical protein
MPTSRWAAFADHLARLFTQHTPAAKSAELAVWEEPRRTLLAAGGDRDALEPEIRGELRAMLKARLRANPEAAAQFLALVQHMAQEVGMSAPAPAQRPSQTSFAVGGSTIYQAGGNITHYGHPKDTDSAQPDR